MTTNDNPNARSTASQTKRILEYLQKGGKLTHRKAERMFKCSRLGARIKEIEKIVGYKPPREFIWVVDKDGERKHVMQYWLHPQAEG